MHFVAFGVVVLGEVGYSHSAGSRVPNRECELASLQAEKSATQ